MNTTLTWWNSLRLLFVVQRDLPPAPVVAPVTAAPIDWDHDACAAGGKPPLPGSYEGFGP